MGLFSEGLHMSINHGVFLVPLCKFRDAIHSSLQLYNSLGA